MYFTFTFSVEHGAQRWYRFMNNPYVGVHLQPTVVSFVDEPPESTTRYGIVPIAINRYMNVDLQLAEMVFGILDSGLDYDN